MTHVLTKLRIDEVSCVIKGANPGARVLIRKVDKPDYWDVSPYLFDDIMYRKAEEEDELRGPRDEEDDEKLSDKLNEIVAEMIVAAPSLHPQRARRWLLHTPQGRELLAKHPTMKKEQPMLDVNKLIPIAEDALMASVNKRDDESYAKAFNRKFENDLGFRKQWASLTEAKHLLALGYHKLYPDVMSVTPVSVEVGATDMKSDADKAYKQLMSLVEEQRSRAPTKSTAQLFAAVFEANPELAGKSLWRSAATG
jgi:hypothetical protein